MVSLAPAPVRTSTGRFRPDIEGLRAIAVLAVALWHAEVPGIPGGFTGVDVFFVLSGYLITSLLLTEYESSNRISLVNFYARRARRLLPAAVLMITITLLVGAFVLAPHELFVAAGSGRAAAVYLSNVWFARAGESYFAQTGPGSPFVHTWSLAVEEQFYLVWPVLMLLCLRVGKSRKALAAVLAVLSLVSFAACLLFSYKSPPTAFYVSPTRAWQFGIGALAVMIPKDRIGLSQRAQTLLGFAGFAGILACFFLLNHIYYPGWRGLFPAIATALVLVCTAPGLLSSPALQWLGGLSYSWYLWHWPMLAFADAFVRPLTMIDKFAALMAALLLAAITHHLVENPIRFNRFLSARPVLSLTMAVALTVFAFAIATAARSFSGALERDPRLAYFVRAAHEVATPPLRCLPETESSRLITCSLGSPAAARHVVLFGDSHAMHWFPAVERVASSHGWTITPLARPGCPSTDSRRDLSWAEDICVAWREQALAWITAHHPDLVILSNIAPTGGARGFHVQSRAIRIYQDGLRRTLLHLARNRIPAILIRDNPHEHFDIPGCLARSARTHIFPPQDCRMTLDALNGEFFEADQIAAAGLENVRLVDLSSEYCQADHCDVQRGDLVLYRDRQHFTRGYARTLAPRIEPELIRILGP